MPEYQTTLDNRETSPIIKFPDDLDGAARQERLGALKQKLENYEERLKPLVAAGNYASPEQNTANRIIDLNMKHFILSSFLENPKGVLNTEDLKNKFADKLKINGLNEKMEFYWDNACGVIGDYIATGGKNTVGSGLP